MSIVPAESNDTLLTATNTGLVAGQSGSVDASSAIGDNSNVAAGLDVDLYKVQLAQGDRLVVDLDALAIASSLASFVRIFDANGSELASENSDFSSTPPTDPREIDFAAGAEGNYYVGISSVGNFSYDPQTEGSGRDGFSVGNYDLKITLSAPVVFTGTPRNDVVTGGEGNDTLSGLAGNDRLFGRGGQDVLNGDAGSDRLFGEAGNDSLSGGTNNDSLDGGAGADTLSGGSGNDSLFGGNDTFSDVVPFATNILNGDGGNDSLRGASNILNTLNGGSGDDTILGGRRFDEISGEDGNDSIVGGADFDRISGGNGNDTLVGVAPTARNELGNSDELTGDAGSDTFVLGDRNRVYYDDGNSFSQDNLDFGLILDLNASEDKIQLKGSAAQYSLDFFAETGFGDEPTGVTNAYVIYDPATEATGERIGLINNVSIDLSLNSSNFIYV
jgi:Ca2+-binding RTX toxin-like protein